MQQAAELIVKTRKNLLSRGFFVTSKAVFDTVLDILRIPPPELFQLTEAQELLDVEIRLNNCIQAFLCNKKLVTLYDLEQFLLSEFRLEKFEQLGLGKLIRHPMVVQMFKISKNQLIYAEITSEKVCEYYYKFLESVLEFSKYDNAQLTVKLKQKSPNSFYAFLSNTLKTNFLGILIMDFDGLHNVLSQNLANNLMILNKFLLKMDKIKQSEYSKLEQELIQEKSVSWKELLEKSGNESLDFSHFAKINVLWAQIAHEWTIKCGNKPFSIGATMMSLDHPVKYNRAVLEMCSCFIYLNFKQPSLLSYCETLTDKQIVSFWVGKCKNGNWKYADLLKYFTSAFSAKLSNPTDSTRFLLYQMVGRLVLSSKFDLDQLDELKAYRHLDHRKLPKLVIDSFNEFKNNGKSLIDLEKELEKMFASPFCLIEKWNCSFLETLQKLFPDLDFSLESVFRASTTSTEFECESVARFTRQFEGDSKEGLLGRAIEYHFQEDFGVANSTRVAEEGIANLCAVAFNSTACQMHPTTDLSNLLQLVESCPMLVDIADFTQSYYLTLYISRFSAVLKQKLAVNDKMMLEYSRGKFTVVPLNSSLGQLYHAIRCNDSYALSLHLLSLLAQKVEISFKLDVEYSLVLDSLLHVPITAAILLFQSVWYDIFIQKSAKFAQEISRLDLTEKQIELLHVLAKNCNQSDVQKWVEIKLPSESEILPMIAAEKPKSQFTTSKTIVRKELFEKPVHSFKNSNTPQGCKDQIKEIRECEFGLGVAESDLVSNLNARTFRAIQKLSTELYSSNTRFVLELLQNADDNQYLASVPEIRFILSNDKLLLVNNEVGFTLENVKSLCDIAKSTKTIEQIGKKGIGFKSVFKITNSPQIHSNGYHIQFNSDSFIVPEVIEPNSMDGWATLMVFPLKTSISLDSLRENILQELDPTILLFLKQIQRVVFIDETSGQIVELKRQLMDYRVVLSRNDSVSEFLVYSESVPGTDSLVQLALPLDPIGPLPLFAWLPLCHYGLRFVLQADFCITSSRQDIDYDNEFNMRIFDCLPMVVANCFVKFSNRYSSLLKLAPLISHVPSNFRPIVSKIQSALLRSEWINGKRPIDCIVIDDSVNVAVQVDVIEKATGLFPISEKLPIEIMNALQISKFGFDHVISIAEYYCIEKQPEKVLPLLQSLSFLYFESRPNLESLRQLEFIPVFNGFKRASQVFHCSEKDLEQFTSFSLFKSRMINFKDNLLVQILDIPRLSIDSLLQVVEIEKLSSTECVELAVFASRTYHTIPLMTSHFGLVDSAVIIVQDLKLDALFPTLNSEYFKFLKSNPQYKTRFQRWLSEHGHISTFKQLVASGLFNRLGSFSLSSTLEPELLRLLKLLNDSFDSFSSQDLDHLKILQRVKWIPAGNELVEPLNVSPVANNALRQLITNESLVKFLGFSLLPLTNGTTDLRNVESQLSLEECRQLYLNGSKYIFIPFDEFKQGTSVLGRFVDSESCVWSDPHGLIDGWLLTDTLKGTAVLSVIYPPEFKTLFENMVPEIPKKEVYNQVLTKIAESADPNIERWVELSKLVDKYDTVPTLKHGFVRRDECYKNTFNHFSWAFESLVPICVLDFGKELNCSIMHSNALNVDNANNQLIDELVQFVLDYSSIDQMEYSIGRFENIYYCMNDLQVPVCGSSRFTNGKLEILTSNIFPQNLHLMAAQLASLLNSELENSQLLEIKRVAQDLEMQFATFKSLKRPNEEIQDFIKRPRFITVNGQKDFSVQRAFDEFIQSNSDVYFYEKSIDFQVQTAKDTGRFGEFLAFNYLKQKYPDSNVEWVNESFEKGFPYDVLVKDSNSAAYFEVKATKSNWRNKFEMSQNEWKFAIDKSEKFTVLRLSNVNFSGSGKIGITFFNNPALLVSQGFIKCQYQLIMFPTE